MMHLKKKDTAAWPLLNAKAQAGIPTTKKEHISYKYPFAEAYRVIKLEILVAEEHVDPVVEIIRANGRTGYRGDGMIIISPVDEVYKVRTDEKGILAI